jgi:hypothetical protein
MATAVRISEELVDEAKRFGRIDHRSLAGQIEHWARALKRILIYHIPLLKKSSLAWTNWSRARKPNTNLGSHYENLPVKVI